MVTATELGVRTHAPVNASIDALHSAAGYVAREWGDYGYRVEYVARGRSWGSVVLCVCASDGSRFAVESDRYGNCVSLGDFEDLR